MITRPKRKNQNCHFKFSPFWTFRYSNLLYVQFKLPMDSCGLKIFMEKMIEIIPVSFTCHSEKNDDVLVQCAPRTKTFAKLAPCICHLPLSYRAVIELAGTASQCGCAVVTLFMGIHDQISTYPREGADDRLRYGYYRSPICWANESH